LLGAWLLEIVRMSNAAQEAMLFDNSCGLPLPQIDVVGLKNIKKRVILRGGKRQFEDISDEVRKYRAAAAALRFQVAGIGNRHVILEFQFVEPFDVPIEDGGAKTTRAVIAAILVDELDPRAEVRVVRE